jgi:hypothetical protein
MIKSPRAQLLSSLVLGVAALIVLIVAWHRLPGVAVGFCAALVCTCVSVAVSAARALRRPH